MASEERIILDLSDDVQTLLEQQHVNLYEELQRELPALRTEMQPDPNAPTGSRGDPITVILAVSTLVSSLTPPIIGLLNQFTPPMILRTRKQSLPFFALPEGIFA